MSVRQVNMQRKIKRVDRLIDFIRSSKQLHLDSTSEMKGQKRNDEIETQMVDVWVGIPEIKTNKRAINFFNFHKLMQINITTIICT